MAYVFGYGSLVEHPAAQVECHIEGHRRRFNVAMDNGVDLPGYKYFLDPETRERPNVYVAFLNLEPQPGCSVNGVAFPVSDDALAAFDRRERNYERRDVTALLREDVGADVFAFVGRPEARERFETGEREGRAVISRDYYAGVLDGFARLGDGALTAFRRSTDEPACPAVDLRRIDLP